MKKVLFLASLLFSLLSQGQPIVKVGCSEYRAFYLTSDGKVRAAVWDNVQVASVATLYPLTGIKEVEGGQYIGVAIDTPGRAWTLSNSAPSVTAWPTDASGQPFTGNVHIYAYMNTQYTLKADGTVWGWGATNPYNFAGWNAKPAQVCSGIPFIKLVTGSTLVGLTSAGDVYEFVNGQPVKRTSGASDVFSSYSDFRGAVIGGRVYAWGGAWANAFFNTKLSASLPQLMPWGQDVVKIAASWNTLKYIDKSGDLYSMGNNAMGEVGIGTEWVNKAEIVPNQYVWDWDGNTKFLPAYKMVYTPVKIGSGFTDIFTGNSWVFYTYALKKTDVYSWGKNKSVVLGNGKAINQESAVPNALDVTTPTLVMPLTAKGRGVNFVFNTISAGVDQAVIGTEATLTGSGTPSTGYVIAGYKWTQTAGFPVTIVNSDRAVTQVTGLSTGKYTFRLQMIDNNGATISGNTNVTAIVHKIHAIIHVDSTVIHYPNTSFILSDASTNSTKGAWLFTGATGRLTDFNGGKLLSNLSEGSYAVQLVAGDDSGMTDTATQVLKVVGPPACPVCPPPVVCPAPRTVTGIQITLFGTVVTIPLAGTKIIFSDGSTQP